MQLLTDKEFTLITKLARSFHTTHTRSTHITAAIQGTHTNQSKMHMPPHIVHAFGFMYRHMQCKSIHALEGDQFIFRQAYTDTHRAVCVSSQGRWSRSG